MLAGENVGVVNSPIWSQRMGKSLAVAHVRPDLTQPGTRLAVTGEGIACSGGVVQTPF